MNEYKTRLNTPLCLSSLPKILTLTKSYEVDKFIDYEKYAKHKAEGSILASLGQYEVELRGGINAATGKRSTLIIDSIVVINNNVSPSKYRRAVPGLSKTTIWQRDRNMCAYCGHVFKDKDLTLDHVIPKSKGGPDTWENLVACCKPCNSWKDDKSLKEAKMELLYLPYVPNHFETLILQNRKILADQMAFLMRGVSKHSRLRLSIDKQEIN
jgi:hypothetical protein